MKLPSLVRVPKHKRFDYNPRVYSPIKERQEQRRLLLDNKHNASQDRIRDGFKRNIERPKSYSKFRWLMFGIFCMLMFSFVYQTWIPLYLTVGFYGLWKIRQIIK